MVLRAVKIIDAPSIEIIAGIIRPLRNGPGPFAEADPVVVGYRMGFHRDTEPPACRVERLVDAGRAAVNDDDVRAVSLHQAASDVRRELVAGQKRSPVMRIRMSRL